MFVNVKIELSKKIMKFILKKRYFKLCVCLKLVIVFSLASFGIKLFYSNKNIPKVSHAENEIRSKSHVSYVHYLNTYDVRTVQNFKYFFHFAYEPCHEEIDFTITINTVDKMLLSGKKDIFDEILIKNALNNDLRLLTDIKSCSNQKNPRRNTYVIVRENKPGGDLCAHVDFFKSAFWVKNKLKYKYYFFINSSARGPFLPNYWLKKW